MAPATLVMARAPIPGRCKTRLQPALGAAGCADLQRTLIVHAARWAIAAAGARAAACVAVDPPQALDDVARLAPGVDLILAQEGEDLGARLAAASARILGLPGAAAGLLVIGTDLPALGSAHAEAASGALADGADVVLGPALDGGYYLVGLARPAPEIFALPPGTWGGPQVLERTLAAAHDAGLRAVVLHPVERDLDEPDDIPAVLADPRTPADVRSVLEAGVR